MKLTSEAVAILVQDGTTHDILERAEETLAVMTAIEAEWAWDRETPTEFAAVLAACGDDPDNLRQLRREALTRERSAEGALTQALAALHAATLKGVGVVRLAWADEPERSELVAPLSARGKVPGEILGEGEEWEAVWRRTDPAFVPATGLTLASLQAQIAAVRTAQGALREAVINRRIADARLAVALAGISEISIAWYALATVIFEAGTNNGDLLRSTIPTTYQPRHNAAAKRRRAAAAARQAGPPVPPGESAAVP